jgi:hypothetical protein
MKNTTESLLTIHYSFLFGNRTTLFEKNEATFFSRFYMRLSCNLGTNDK